MRDLALKLFRSNHELLDFAKRSQHLQSATNRRSAIKVAVIDDDPFLPQVKLQSYGYNLTALGDIKKISEVSDYDVILCDIMGVGQHFGSNAQGASLIAEIKNEYPSKVVVAYTGGTPSDQADRLMRQWADAVIKKDIDNQEWVQKLDEIAFQAVDPHEIWNKIRARFVSLDVDTKTILTLEDAYVRSILSGDAQLGYLVTAASNNAVGGDVRSIINGIIGNAIFMLIANA